MRLDIIEATYLSEVVDASDNESAPAPSAPIARTVPPVKKNKWDDEDVEDSGNVAVSSF